MSSDYAEFIRYAQKCCDKLAFSFPYYSDIELDKYKKNSRRFLEHFEPFILNEYEGEIGGNGGGHWIYVIKFDYRGH